MWIHAAVVGVVAVLGACGKAAEPISATREAAAIALATRMPPLNFTTRGKDKEVLVVQLPRSDAELCEAKALEAMVRMQPDPDNTADHTDRDSHVISTGDLAKDMRPLKEMFKTEVTPEMRARMEEVRKLISQFGRIECETKTGVVIGVPIP